MSAIAAALSPLDRGSRTSPNLIPRTLNLFLLNQSCSLLGLASFIYRLIGHWFVVSVAILIFAGYGFIDGSISLKMQIVAAVLGYVSPPILIYLLSAGVMDAHGTLINERIEGARRGLAVEDDIEGAHASAHEQIAAEPQAPPPGTGRGPRKAA